MAWTDQGLSEAHQTQRHARFFEYQAGKDEQRNRY